MNANPDRTLTEKLKRFYVLGSGAWLMGAFALVLLSFLRENFTPAWYVVTYLLLTVVMSIVCFIAFGIDKRRARKDQQRISERTLHILEFLGGWPGAVLAQACFRHKTQKLSFRFMLWLIVALHLCGSCYAVYHILFDAEPAAEATETADTAPQRYRLT